MKSISCRVHEISALTPFVYKVLLEPECAVEFEAGQYLNFVMAEDDKRPFSIASAPDAAYVELQIGAFEANSYAMQVIDRIKASDQVTVEIPLGNAQLRLDSERPILLLAGGTGFSYIKSMFEHLANTNTKRPVIIYWGAREPSALYELEKTQQTIDKIANASFIPVVENADSTWTGKVGLVHQVAMQDIMSFEPYDIYLAGRFEMVGAVREDFINQGGYKEHMFADAFSFI